MRSHGRPRSTTKSAAAPPRSMPTVSPQPIAAAAREVADCRARSGDQPKISAIRRISSI